MLKEALQYILDGMRPETQDLCGRAYVITPSGAQEVIETPIVPATLPRLSIWQMPIPPRSLSTSLRPPM